MTSPHLHRTSAPLSATSLASLGPASGGGVASVVVWVVTTPEAAADVTVVVTVGILRVVI